MLDEFEEFVIAAVAQDLRNLAGFAAKALGQCGNGIADGYTQQGLQAGPGSLAQLNPLCS
ncbi:hypothetical protein BST46_25860 [Mycobacterium timonense]|uniref:PE family protein n=2 Tax=Mycobacterium avium complex (MAC) TaxID=120793 RepID=A0ABX3TEF3_9MYCO|nr:hypothetical protein BST19_26920 [Mycobacterium bouchedurhonense]ORB77196.1 hypothetical protein BST46_25860 [Mycobacterium timonense]